MHTMVCAQYPPSVSRVFLCLAIIIVVWHPCPSESRPSLARALLRGQTPEIWLLALDKSQSG